ncbi:MAG: hypothetical protein IT445_20145 [Phycisphaeraceae bacterium]|nr:hypothetical protein [Phycisphaeraceae bacterium]
MTRLLPVIWMSLLLSAAPLLAQDQLQNPAALAPADAAVFLELHDVAQLQKQWSDDPILQRIYDHMPARKNPDAWLLIQVALGMDGRQIINTYFSRQIVLIGQAAGKGQPGVILSRINPADAQRVIQGLMLTKIAKAGDFDVYEPQDRNSVFAFGNSWMAIADAYAEPFLMHVLDSMKAGPHLADDEQYQQHVARLPAARHGTAFMRDEHGTHAVGLVSRDDGFALHYAGASDKFARVLSKLGDARTLDFGPTPPDAIFAATLNLYNPNPRNMELVDRLIAPRTFQHDVLPGLGAPLVVWISPITIDEEDHNAASLGLAVHLVDDNVRSILDSAFNNLILIANFTGLQWGLPAFSPEARAHDDHAYTVAGIGAALAQRSGVNILRHVELAYGSVGDWYVLTSNAQTFNAALDSLTPPKPEAAPADTTSGGGTSGGRPIARLRFNGLALADLLTEWSTRLGESPAYGRRPQAVRAVEKLTKAADWLGHFQRVEMSLDTDESGAILGELDVTRP